MILLLMTILYRIIRTITKGKPKDGNKKSAAAGDNLRE